MKYITDNKIPVVFSTDENYARPTIVTMVSIVKNAQITTFYNFYLLIPTNFSSLMMQNIADIQSIYPNCSISFVPMGNAFNDIKLFVSHTSLPTYYRLQICDLLPECKKCIYLDSDTIVNGDLTEFFNINLDDYYIAGVKAPGYHFPPDGNKDYCEKVGLLSINQYINAGVLLMNLTKMRKDHLTDVFMHLAQKELPSQDQDILNIACYNSIKHIHFKYNNMLSKYQNAVAKVKKVIPEQEINEAIEKTTIFHFCDEIKPWQDIMCYNADLWWHYAKITPIYKEILLQYTPQLIDGYFEKSKMYENKIKELQNEIKTSENKIIALQNEIKTSENKIIALQNNMESIQNSKSLKLGKAITFFPRKIRSLFKDLFKHDM